MNSTTLTQIVHPLNDLVQGCANGIVIGAAINWCLGKLRERRAHQAEMKVFERDMRDATVLSPRPGTSSPVIERSYWGTIYRPTSDLEGMGDGEG